MPVRPLLPLLAGYLGETSDLFYEGPDQSAEQDIRYVHDVAQKPVHRLLPWQRVRLKAEPRPHHGSLLLHE